MAKQRRNIVDNYSNSLNAFILKDKKKVFGNLVLTDNYCQFTDENNDISKFSYNIIETVISTHSEKVSLIAKAKSYIWLTYHNTNSDKYYIEEDVNAVIKEFNARKTYVIKETARLKKESELRRKEEERRLAEEKRKIEVQQILSAKNTRINKILTKIKYSNNEVSFDDKITSLNKSAVAYITENPRRILGLPCDATIETANSSFERFKKLSRIGAIESFDSEFKLYGLKAPKRDISICQKALTDCKALDYSFFWFIGEMALIGWISQEYRNEFACDGIRFANYDIFLAMYLYLLVTDPKFKNKTDWQNVFEYINLIYANGSINLLKSRIAEDKNFDLSEKEILDSFKKAILKPVYELINVSNTESLLRLYLILSAINKKTFVELETKLPAKITSDFNETANSFSKIVEQYDKNPSATNLRSVEKSYNDFKAKYSNLLKYFEAIFGTQSTRLTMLKDKYKSTTWGLMAAYNNHDSKDEAIGLANELYKIASDEEKNNIRFTFGIKAVKYAENKPADAEFDILGDNYYNGENGYEQDYFKAFSFYEKAANNGNMYSMNSLGICYEEGKGTSQNEIIAAMWYENAYLKGNPDGAYNLAECYYNGTGKTKDIQKALNLWIEAAKMGHPTAANRGKQVLDNLQAELELQKLAVKTHRLSQHNHYNLGYQMPIAETIIVEVDLNYSANVYLMNEDNYALYTDGDNFEYYGGRANQSPYRIKIPYSDFWHLVVDNGDDDMTGIISTVHTRTFNF